MHPQLTNMEEILSHLLVPDNETIGQATKALQQSFKTGEAVPQLCNVLSTSVSSQIRQYAAVLLRKRLTKQKNWNKLTPEVQNMVKSGILPLVINEKEKIVKTSVVQFIGAIAKHELSKGTWPDLPKFLESLITSHVQSDVELGMYTMSVLTEIALDVFATNPAQFVFLFNTTIRALDDLNTVLGYYTVLTMTHVTPICQAHPELASLYSKAIPRILLALPRLAAADEEKAFEVMDFFSEIMTDAVPLLTPDMSHFIKVCLHIAGDRYLGDSIRDRAMTLIGAAVRVKKKLIIKLDLVKPIVDVLFGVMCEAPKGDEEDDNEDWFAEYDNETPCQSATNVLGVLSIYLPPNKLLEILFEHVNKHMSANLPCVTKGCFLALAIVIEGASECIRNNYLKVIITWVCSGVTDNSPTIRNAALFALGQLSEHLQPEISEYAGKLMPIFFEYLTQLCNRLAKGSADPPGIFTMFYALESFCENLEMELSPYLALLMERLLMTLERKHSVNVQELALSAIGAVASAVKTEILPFFPLIMEKLKMYLLETPTEETSCLQAEALQTLSLVARTMGPEHFAPLAQETMTLGLKLLESSEDPELKSAIYSLFGSLSFIMKEESSAFMPVLVENLILSLKSTEGVVATYKEEDGPFSVYEDLVDSEGEEDIEKASSDSDDEPDEFMVENPYMDEKEEACVTLKEFAKNAGASFLPYLEKCFGEIFELTSYPNDDVRKGSFDALAEFCVCFSKIGTAEGNQALQKALEMVVSQCTDLALKDDECTVVIATLEALTTMLNEIGAPVLATPGCKEAILKVINDVLLNKAECQDREEGEATEEGDGEAEQDEVLIESAGEVIPALGKAVTPEEFIICLQSLLPAILSKLSKQSSISSRSFFIGTLAECMAHAGPELQKRQDLSLQLLNLFMPLARDSSRDVRNNAIFGLGELVLHSKQSLYSKYMDILTLLSSVLQLETQNGVVDNICGALARIIVTNHEIVPVDDVFPVLLKQMPLREDFDEYKAVIQCFGFLYQLGHPSIKTHLKIVIRIICDVLRRELDNEEVNAMTTELIRNCWKDFPTETQEVVQEFPPDIAVKISNLLTSS